MSAKLPLVLSTTGQTQRLQSSDTLSEDTGLVSKEDFEQLQTHFRLLCGYLLNEGFDLPPELVAFL